MTVVSLPENPPIAATSAPDSMIAWLAPDWLEIDDRAAAVGLGVGHGRGQLGRVAAEHPAAAARRRGAAGARSAARRRPVAPARPGVPPRCPTAAHAAAAARAAATHRLRGRRATGGERRARRVAERLHRPGRGREQQDADRGGRDDRADALARGEREPAGERQRRADDQPARPGEVGRAVGDHDASVSAPPARISGPATRSRVSSEQPAPTSSAVNGASAAT